MRAGRPNVGGMLRWSRGNADKESGDGPNAAEKSSLREFDTARGTNIRVLVAPSSSAHRRANTSDSLTFLLDRVPLVRRRHVLIITSAIYAPYQSFAGAPVVLSDGADHVELVGIPLVPMAIPTY